jgi:putative Mg2+ transporter-C (MgtC) family protein
LSADSITTSQWDLILRLVVAAVLGGLIGLERETGKRPAGLRTYMLVCLGSALFTMLSIYAFPMAGSAARDTARVAAQVVVGIGFLGAGTLWRSRNMVHGLTTAAGLWVVAAIGMAVGSGFVLLAAASTILVLVILSILHRIEQYIPAQKDVPGGPIEPPDEDLPRGWG